MAVYAESLYITCEVASDLSAGQYHFVKVSGADNRIILCDSAGEEALGILQEPVDGSSDTQSARVCVAGKSKIRLGATVTRGAALQTLADGEGGTAAADDTVNGYLLESGVDQDIKHCVVCGRGEFQN
jgi:hypothetical protein